LSLVEKERRGVRCMTFDGVKRFVSFEGRDRAKPANPYIDTEFQIII